MLKKIDRIRNEFAVELAAVDSLKQLTSVRDKYLSRKSGIVTLMMKELQQVAPEDRREFGQQLNALKGEVEGALQTRETQLADNALIARLVQ